MASPDNDVYRCEVCGVSAAETAIHRTSPKGKGMPFRGRCEAHLERELDADVLRITDAVEFDNLRRRYDR